MPTEQLTTSAGLGHLVRDPPPYLPPHWRPAPLPPCPPADLARVITGLRQLGPRGQVERR